MNRLPGYCSVEELVALGQGGDVGEGVVVGAVLDQAAALSQRRARPLDRWPGRPSAGCGTPSVSRAWCSEMVPVLLRPMQKILAVPRARGRGRGRRPGVRRSSDPPEEAAGVEGQAVALPGVVGDEVAAGVDDASQRLERARAEGASTG